MDYRWFSSIAVRDSIVHVAWRDERNGNLEVYYKRSIDNGTSWEPDRRLTINSAKSLTPPIAVRDSIVHVVWADSRNGNYQI